MTRVLTRGGIAVAGLSAVGVLVSFLLNVFVLGGYADYGQVRIPGSGTVHMPAGPATISFHALTPSGGGAYVIPRLSFRISSPDGASEPKIVEDSGGFTSVNADVHARVWRMDVAQAGDYRIEAEGDVSAFISPRLAFGHGSAYGWVPWACAGVCLVSVLVVVVTGLARSGHTFASSTVVASSPGPSGATFNPTSVGASPAYLATPARAPAGSSDVLERLESLARLRANGDLTPAEFETAKQRVLAD